MSKTVLILGAGPGLGNTLASTFANDGYKVALVARSADSTKSNDNLLHIQADLSDPDAIPKVFDSVVQAFGNPNIVIYNVANRQLTPPDDPLSVPLSTLEISRRPGVDSAYVAAQQALLSFKALPSDIPKAFFYTGNTLNQMPIPGVLPFAMAKSAAATMVEYCANAYGVHGYRFYYLDERQPNGRPMAGTDGLPLERHGDMYLTLAYEKKQSKPHVVWIHGEGRVDFQGVDFNGETRVDYDRKFGR